MIRHTCCVSEDFAILGWECFFQYSPIFYRAKTKLTNQKKEETIAKFSLFKKLLSSAIAICSTNSRCSISRNTGNNRQRQKYKVNLSCRVVEKYGGCLVAVLKFLNNKKIKYKICPWHQCESSYIIEIQSKTN